LSDGRVVAVLEFFSSSPSEPDNDLLLMVRALGAQVGRVFERKRNEDHRALLVDELTHRAKNTMAVVQGVANQTFRTATSVSEARDLFEGRLAAMSAAHDLLADAHWEQASMREIVEAAIGGSGSVLHRFRITGPDFGVPARIAVSLTLALHELCTNAFKYGALSVPTGEVSISWERQDESGFRFEWRENGGPPVRPPTRKGFGTSLLKRGLANELGGNLDLEFRSDGLRCTFDSVR
jgi:two-component sensor histidine kinase